MAITAVSAQKLTDAWNTHRPEAVAALYAPGGARVVMAYPGGRLEGREALAEHVREIMTACPDCSLETRSTGVSADGSSPWSGPSVPPRRPTSASSPATARTSSSTA